MLPSTKQFLTLQWYSAASAVRKNNNTGRPLDFLGGQDWQLLEPVKYTRYFKKHLMIMPAGHCFLDALILLSYEVGFQKLPPHL